MANQELIRIFSEIAIFLKMEEIPFKPKAYEKTVLGLETLVRDVKEIYEQIKQVYGDINVRCKDK